MCSIGQESLGAVLAGLAAEDLTVLPDAALADGLVELRRMIEGLEAQWLRRLEVFDRRGAAAASGAVSTAGWLRSACRLAPSAARARVELARALPGLPDTAAALAAGEISVGHAGQIAAAVTELAEVA